ncbi:MAG: Ig-like domain-containing protein [Vicinamibacterales bacterium]
MESAEPLRESVWRRGPGTAARRVRVVVGLAVALVSGAVGAFAQGPGPDRPALTTTFSANAATLGAIPDGPGTPNLCGPSGIPKNVTFTVTGMGTTLTDVSVSVTFSGTGPGHPFAGDLTAILISPSAQVHVLFGRTGATTATGCGDSSDLVGPYVYSDSATESWWPAATAAGAAVPIPSGAYRTSQSGGVGATGANTLMAPAFSGSTVNGTWTLRLTDSGGGDTASVVAASLTVTTGSAPTTVADSYTTPFNTVLGVAAPGVLANDVSVGAATAQLVSPPSHGTLTLTAAGGFTYSPNGGFVGADGFQYRAVNDVGPGNTVQVLVMVQNPTIVQPPYNLRVENVVGRTVTLRWDIPSIGPRPDGFVLEGGVSPGQVAAQLLTGSPVPVFTFEAPVGSFFIRMRALTGQISSGVSGEVPLHVGVPVPPSAPQALLATVNGNALSLSWKNSFTGGAPTGMVIDATGSLNAAVPIGVGESATFPVVPAGAYTLRLRAVNGGGSSPASRRWR